MSSSEFDWTQGGRRTYFRYMRVKWPFIEDKEEGSNKECIEESGGIEGITSCSIEEDSLSSLKVSGSLEYENLPDIGDDLVRIYSISELDGKTEETCHGTFFVSTPTHSVSAHSKAGRADMYSVLQVLKDDMPDSTFTVEQGANAVDVAAMIVRDHGLIVTVTPSDYTLSTSRSFSEQFSYLEVVNDLLDVAGYASAEVAPRGDVLIKPYEDPAVRRAVVVLSDKGGVTNADFSHELDTYAAPNIIKLVSSNAENKPIFALVENNDQESPYSTVNRGKRICRKENVSDIKDQDSLTKKAKELLLSSLSVVEKIEIGHAWLPFSVGDAVLLDYPKSGFENMKLVAIKRRVSMTPDLACQTTLRRFVNLLDIKEVKNG